MMEAKLCIYICNTLVPEVSQLLQSGNYPDVAVKSFPAACIGCSLNDQRITDMVADEINHFSKIIFIVSACKGNKNVLRPINEKIEIIHLEQCFELYLSLPIIYHFIKQGNYLVSSGWLRNYKQHIHEWGFDEKSAKKFFGESMQQILLLETDLPGDYRQNLEALSEYMGLPFDIIPIGNSHLQKFIRSLTSNWRSENDRKALNERIAKITRESADYSLIFSQLKSMINLTDENLIENELANLLNILFFPKEISFQKFNEGKMVNDTYFKKTIEPFLFTDENSFTIVIEHHNELLGKFIVSGVQFPQFLHQYHTMGQVISQIGGLSIENARKFAELKNANLLITESEIKFRNLVNQMQFGLAVHEIILDESGIPIDYRFLDINPSFEKITGLTREKIIGKTVLEVLPKIEKSWIKNYGLVALTGQTISFEDYSKELEKYFGIVAYQPQEKQFAVITEDITQRKKTEIMLKESEEQHRLMFETSQEAIVITQDYRFKYFNPTMCDLTGYSEKELANMKFIKLIHPDDLDFVVYNYRRRISGEYAEKRYEYRLLQKDGNVKWVTMTGTQLIWNGKPATFNFINDITEQKESASKLAQSNQKFIDLSKSAAEMLNLNTVDEIYEYLANALHEQYPHAVIIFSVIDELQQNSLVTTIKGIPEFPFI